MKKIKILACGFLIMGSLLVGCSSNTTTVQISDTESNSSKNRKAKELSIPIISELDFLNMITE